MTKIEEFHVPSPSLFSTLKDFLGVIYAPRYVTCDEKGIFSEAFFDFWEDEFHVGC